jgi:hypothetical protein
MLCGLMEEGRFLKARTDDPDSSVALPLRVTWAPDRKTVTDLILEATGVGSWAVRKLPASRRRRM